MSRNALYATLGVLGLLVIALAAYVVYQQQQQPQLSISVDKNGIKVNGNG
ncbi:MAG: hypothetical protein ABI697_02505 [Devosia sp.]